VRLIDYIKGRDRRLVFMWMGPIGPIHFDYKFYDVYNSPEKQLELSKKVDDFFGSDFYQPLDDGPIFGESFGLPLMRPDYDFAIAADSLVKNWDILRGMRVLDPNKDGRMPVNMETFKLLSENTDKPLAISLQGPFTLASELAGVTELMRMIVRDAEFVHTLLDITRKTVFEYAKVAIEHGVKMITVCEPTAINLSPKQFAEFVKPGYRLIFDNLQDVWKVLHICGDTNYLLDEILDCGAEGLSLESEVDFPSVVKRIPKDVVLIGNLDTFVAAESSADEIRQITHKLLYDMREHANFIPCPACDLMASTPIENIKAFIETSKTKTTDLQKSGG
jgi:uroporphyrinogen decarboxylase